MKSNRIAIVYLEENAPIDLRNWMEVSLAAAVLRMRRIPTEVTLVKTARHRDQLFRQWQELPPELIFLPIARDQLHASEKFLNELVPFTKTNPDCSIAVGGVMGTLSTQVYSAHPAVRAILLGDSLEPLEELSLRLLSDLDGSDLPSVWWRGKEGWILSQKRKRLRTFAELPEPELGVFRVADLMKVTGGCLPMLASRGFPFRTLFSPQPLLRHLQESENYYETLSPTEAVNRAKLLVSQYNPSRIEFVDELFPWNTRWVQEFATRWADEVGLPYSINTSADHLTEDTIRELAGSGLKTANIFLESGNDQFRARFSDLNKTNKLVRTALKLSREQRVQVNVTFLLGLPDENPETLRQTLDFAQSLGADGYTPQVFIPWPRTAQWVDTAPADTIPTDFICPPAYDNPELRDPLNAAYSKLLEMDTFARARLHPREKGALLDGIADFEKATVRSPLSQPVRLTTFYNHEGANDVIALRVPSQVVFPVTLTANAIIRFGVLLEPTLPGLRAREGVSFSIKLTQKEKTWRLFQKVLIQALDPDSRRWHWFTLPLKPSVPGDAELAIECTLYRKGGDAVPEEGDIWAGWGKVIVEDGRNVPFLDSALFGLREDE